MIWVIYKNIVHYRLKIFNLFPYFLIFSSHSPTNVISKESGLIVTPHWPHSYRGFYQSKEVNDRNCFWNIHSRKHSDFYVVIMYLDLADVTKKSKDCYNGQDTLTFEYRRSNFFFFPFLIVLSIKLK